MPVLGCVPERHTRCGVGAKYQPRNPPMTYQNDPNINPPVTQRRQEASSYTGWIIGGLVALAVITGVIVMFGHPTDTASTTNSGGSTASSTSAPASRTGDTT